MSAVDILEPSERRRIWSAQEKAALLAEIDAAGGKVRLVARRHRISESVLYNWRSARKAAAVAMGAPEDVELALLQSVLWAHGSFRRPHQAVSNSSRALTNWTTSASAEAPRPKARSTMRASPQMSFVMLKVDACPLRSACITSKPLIVA